MEGDWFSEVTINRGSTVFAFFLFACPVNATRATVSLPADVSCHAYGVLPGVYEVVSVWWMHSDRTPLQCNDLVSHRVPYAHQLSWETDQNVGVVTDGNRCDVSVCGWRYIHNRLPVDAGHGRHDAGIGYQHCYRVFQGQRMAARTRL